MNNNQQKNPAFGDAHPTAAAFITYISGIGIAILIAMTMLTALVVAEKVSKFIIINII